MSGLRMPRRLHVAMAGTVGAVAVAEISINAEITPKAAAWPLELAMAISLLVLATSPLIVVLVVAGLQVVEAAANVPLNQPVVPLLASVLAVYALVAQASVRRATVGMTAMVLAIGVETVLQHKGFGNFLFGLVFAAAAFAVARVVAHRTDAADDLVARTRQLEESREADARRAVEEERARIARELHDVIAHSVGVMVVQAGGAERVLPKDPAAAVDALRSVQTTGRQALAEMARLVGILRGLGEEIGLAPQPGLAEIATLVDASRAAGLDVDVCIDGTQRALPPGVELTVYRVVQEALTNVRKHGVGSRAAVRVRFGSRDVEVEVRNPTDSANRAGAPGGGHGLIGMRQRVEIYDGRLESGPLPDGTFRVRAEIPVAG